MRRVEVAVRGAGGEEGEDGGEEGFSLGGGVGEEEVAFRVGGLVRCRCCGRCVWFLGGWW